MDRPVTRPRSWLITSGRGVSQREEFRNLVTVTGQDHHDLEKNVHRMLPHLALVYDQLK